MKIHTKKITPDEEKTCENCENQQHKEHLRRCKMCKRNEESAKDFWEQRK